MALAIDASSPAVATQTTGTVATVVSGSFTPPANSVLEVLWSGDGGTSPTQPTITDNLGTPLIYTRTDWMSVANAPNAGGQAAAWTAPVGASPAAMTVTVTSGSISGERTAALKVVVWTGADTTNPAAAHGMSGSKSAASIAQSYTATANSGQGTIAVCDFDQAGAETAGTGATLIASANVATNFTYGFLRRTSADDVSGNSNTLNVTLPGTSTNLNWVYVEMQPASASAPSLVATGPAYLVMPGGVLMRAFAMNRVLPQIFGGAVANQSALSATVGFTGADTEAVGKTQSATVSFTGTNTRGLSRTLTAAVSFTGAATLRTARALAGTVAFVGAVTTLAVHHFTQALSATLSFTGAQVRSVGKAVGATLSFTGALPRAVARVSTATVGFVGTLPRRTAAQQAATLSFTGTRTARTSRALAATVSFTGSVATAAVHFFTQALSATVGFTGTLVKRAARPLSATLGATGALIRRAQPALAATLGLSGTQTRRTASHQAATLTPSGAVTRRTSRALSATVSATGSLATQLGHLFLKALSATVGFAATVAGFQPPSWTAGVLDSSATVAGEREPGQTGVSGTDPGGTGISGTG